MGEPQSATLLLPRCNTATARTLTIPPIPSLVTVQPAPKRVRRRDPTRIDLGNTRDGDNARFVGYHFEHCMDVLGVGVIIGVTLYESFC